MSEKVKFHDFIELDYIGTLADGTVFDTTSEEIAHTHNLTAEKKKFAPLILCVGEHQVLPGLDKQLEGKEMGKTYTLTLPPEQAFGKREIKKVKIVPLGTFREHKLDPYPGLQVDMDGELGLVSSVSGGRVIVNFNHPLAGKEIHYEITIRGKVTDLQQQILSFLQATIGLPREAITVQIENLQATVTLPLEFPLQVTDALMKKLKEITSITQITFIKASKK